MKIRFKLIASLLLAIILPVIIISCLLKSDFIDMACKSEKYALKNLTTTKAGFIEIFINNTIDSLKSFSADETVRRFTADCAESEEDYLSSDDYVYVFDKIKNEVEKNDCVKEINITDESGKILASNNSKNIGVYIEDFEQIKTSALANNGISYIFAPHNGLPCYIYAVRRIYSPNNLKVGFVSKKIILDELTEQFKLSGYSNYASCMIIDSNGKYITGSVSNPKRIEDVAEYRGIAEHLANVIPFYSNSSQSETMTAEYDSYFVAGTLIPESNWCFVSTYDVKAAKANKKLEFSGSVIYIIIFVSLSLAVIIFISLKFTEPIHKMINVIKKHNKGNTDARLDFNTNDEFGDISTAFNAMIDSLSTSDKRYHAVLSMSDNVVFEVDLKKFTVYTSDNFNQKFSFRAKNSSINESFLYKIKIHKDDTKKYLSDLDHIVSSVGEKWEGEYRFKNIYGDFSWIRIKSVKLMDRNGTPEKIIGTLTDIDREKKSAINLMQKANFDALTQLYNRASFLRSLDEEMQLSAQRRSLDALMFIDLDDFKHFNDEFGHKCGDEVLKFVADTIKEITFDKGFGGRLGGDEFVMCLTNLKLIGDAGKVAAEVITILNQGFISESCGEKFGIHCSIGIAFFRENGSNSTELLESADAAMYKIKKSGKSNYAYYGIDPASAASPAETIHPREATFDNTFLR